MYFWSHTSKCLAGNQANTKGKWKDYDCGTPPYSILLTIKHTLAQSPYQRKPKNRFPCLYPKPFILSRNTKPQPQDTKRANPEVLNAKSLKLHPQNSRHHTPTSLKTTQNQENTASQPKADERSALATLPAMSKPGTYLRGFRD